MSERKKQVDQVKAGIWTKYIRAGLDAKQEWLAAARDVMGYFNVSHDHFFNSALGAGSTYLDLANKGICVSVNRAALVRSVIGPHLYQKAPKREVNTTQADAVSMALARLLEHLLNYAIRESGYTKSVYRLIDSAELLGVGFLRTGWDETYKINTSHWVSSERVVVDPAAVTWEDARWIAVSTRMPVDEIVERYGEGADKWRVEGIDGVKGKEELEGEQRMGALKSYLRDQVSVWDVYSKQGTGLRRGPEALDEGHEFRDDNDDKKFVKFTVVLDHAHLLDEGEWELPLYLDKSWPLTPLMFVESLDRFWGPSPMQQAMVHQKNMDLFASLLTSQSRIHARDLFFYRSGCLDENAVEQFLHGGPSEAIPVGDLPAGLQPKDVIHQLTLGRSDEGIMRALEWHTQQFDLITGATPVLQGGYDPGPQDRSATASQQKSAAANVRLMDQLSRLEDALAQAARNEAIAWRLGGLAKDDDVARIAGDLPLGYRLDGPVPIPLRGEGVSLESLHAPCATYFETPDQALVHVEALWTAMLQAAAVPSAGKEAREIQTYVAALTRDMPPDAMIPPGLAPRKVLPRDVFEDTAGMSPEDVVREYSFTVAEGSTQKQDPSAKRERATSLEQNALPAALKSGDYNMVNAILDRADEAFGVPPDERLPPMQPPAMPMGEPPAGGGI